jgi:allophanate hydrolase
MAPLSLDLTSVQAAYAAGTLTPTKLVGEIIRRLDAQGDPAVWIHRLPHDELLAHARRLESRSPAGLPLYGVPFAIKDNLDLAGAPTTAACPEFAYSPAESAVVVQRLLEAGAIPVGKTNLDQFATGLTGVRSPYGIPRNPFRPEVIPGGSSSGSAVAVSAGLVSFALGTDTAGSGRVPAGLNNLVGLKPTRGALSTRGLVPACRSLDCVSVFALTCADAAAVGRVLEGIDPADPYSRPRPKAAPVAPPSRIGVPGAGDLAFFGDAAAEQLFHRSLDRVAALGARLVEIDFAPFRETAALLYQGPWVAERWAGLRAFHQHHAGAFLPVTRQIVEAGGDLSAVDVFDGLHKLAALARRAGAEWEKMDALLLPTIPRPYTLAEVAAEPVLLNSHLGTYTNFVNLLDLCAVAVPAGFRADGLPWGVTLLAPAWSEPALLDFGARWHAGVGGPLGATAHPLPAAVLRLDPPPVESLRLAVVGAHLSGQPLNQQLTALRSRLVWTGRTAPVYRLYALAYTTPPKPGLVRVAAGGAAIALEVWELDAASFGRFVAAVPSPMCIGTVALETGEDVKGFLCEPAALAGAEDITGFGGWRNFCEERSRAG